MLKYFISIFVLTMSMLPIAAVAQDDAAEQMRSDIESLRQPFSVIDHMSLNVMKRNAAKYSDQPGYASYVAAIDKALEGMEIYNNCISVLNKPYNNKEVVEARTELIARLEEDGYFTPQQYTEMDMIDIYLSRYRNAWLVFQKIIKKINDDADVTDFRATAKKGRPTPDQREKAKKAMFAIVYRPNSNDFTQEIKDYIMIIPYLNDRLSPYLNAVLQQPATKTDTEKIIMSIRP